MARQVLTIPDVPPTLLQTATAAATYVAKTGDTMTGALRLDAGLNFQGDTTLTRTAAGELALGDKGRLYLRGADGTAGNRALLGATPAGLLRWSIDLGNGNALSTGNVGAQFVVSRWSDAGAYLGSPLVIERSTGTLTLTPDAGQPALVAQGNVGVGANPPAWGSGHRALQVGGAAGVFANAASPGSGLTDNSYYDGAAFRSLFGANASSSLTLVNGEFQFGTAPVVAAGAAQTFTTRMSLAQNGTLTLTPAAGQLALVLNRPDATPNYYTYLNFARAGLGKFFLGLGPSDDFILYDSTSTKARMIVNPTGTLTLTPDAGQHALVWGGNGALTHESGHPELLSNTGILWVRANGGNLAPVVDNNVANGGAGNRWTAVYAVAGAINTSSLKYKDPYGDLDPAVALTAVLRTPARRFKYKGTERVQSGYYLEEADPLFTIGPDEASANNDTGILLAAIQALSARIAQLEAAR